VTKTWRDNIAIPPSLRELLVIFHELQTTFDTSVPGASSPALAFRGVANCEHALTPSLQWQHGLEAHEHTALAIERALIEGFQQRAGRFLGELERRYLFPQIPLNWFAPSIWGAIAVARHYGVPTRLLDWTRNVSVAAFFAACADPEKDGAIWWFSQAHFEAALRWDAWEVPPNEQTDERAMERKAFQMDATPWISKIHYPLPFARLEKQAGFFTACGRLGICHNDAIDLLDDGNIPRGLIVVQKAVKSQLLNYLEAIGFRASTIDYPGADAAGLHLTSVKWPRA
jgi:hypothetical protein